MPSKTEWKGGNSFWRYRVDGVSVAVVHPSHKDTTMLFAKVFPGSSARFKTVEEAKAWVEAMYSLNN